MASREERIGQNEAVFRDVNERIAQIGFGDDIGFLCECGHARCAAAITMPLAEYEAVRANPTRFFLIPGHEIPDVEDVVEVHEDYLVVEKRPGIPTEVAVENDPRSET